MAFKLRYIWLSALLVLAITIARFPANWAAKIAVPDASITFGGTIWNGFMSPINAIPPIKFTTTPIGLLTDAPVLEFSGAGNGISINGEADQHELTRVILTGDAVFLGQIDGRMKNLLGRFDMVVGNLPLGGNCEGVSGTISTDILTRNAALWQWEGPPLTGPVTCENDILTSTLSGNITGQSVEAELKIMPDGNYQIRAVINTNTPEAGLVLPLYGFESQGERFTMNEAGRWM